MRFFTLPKTVVGRIIGATLVILLLCYIFSLPKQLFKVSYSTVVTDRNNELLGARIALDGQWRFPERNITPDKIKTALLEFEDGRFYYHWGVDLIAIARATYQNIKGGRVISGGSTLTMQTIRIARDKPRTFWEKFKEIILATRLEFRYSKKEILSLYLSHAPFGGNIVGIDAAAWRYFGHPAEELSWAEAATLAVLPNSPSMINLSKSRQALLTKRDKLLTRLYKKGVMSESSYELAKGEPLPLAPQPLPQIAPHLTDYFYQIRRGEYSVSTIDIDIQSQIENLVERWNGEFSRSDIRNIAILVIDVQKNQPVAYCGNVHFNKEKSGNQVDIIRSPRSTGSILKPFLYNAMLQEGSLLPNTLLPDIPINISGFAPQNFSQQFEGAVPASEALARSLNIPTVTMLQSYGVPKFYNYLKQGGISTLKSAPSHYGLSLILGGAEGTLWDITCMYTNMARVLDGLENTICSPLLIDSSKLTNTATIFQKGGVWQTFNAIKEVNRPEEIDWRIIPSMQTIAWKTGTSYGFRDAWAVGVTPKYAVGVWVGNASGEGKAGLVGARTAGPVLFDIFNLLPSSKWFTPPSNEFIDAEVCKLSGYLKGRFCEEADTLHILPAGLKSETCPYHHLINVTPDESYRVYNDGSGGDISVQRKWFTLPPVWEWYYKQHHPEYKPLPPLKKGVSGDMFTPMQFVYPTMNARVFLPKQMDGSSGKMTIELAHSNSNATVYWHIDNSYLTETQNFHKVSILPTAGKHTVTAVDGEGNSLSVSFWVE